MQEMKKNVSLLEKSKCYSCRSCFLSCPKGAITMEENTEGFFYPSVDEARCTGCGLCARRCPALSPRSAGGFTGKTYAARLKDRERLLQSASGGVFAGLAEAVLAEGGVVFGAVYDDGMSVRHIAVESASGLQRLKGSKYVESFTGDSFREAEAFLKSGRTVLYSGTPCQIAGLRAFLGKDYDNLLTVDLICHGVPSRKLFAKYLEWLGRKCGGRIIYYGFRDKDVGGWSCGGKFKTKTKTKTKTMDALCDPYYASFLRGETYRESCYTCPFAGMERAGDITVGDFWGIERFHPDFDRDGGVSAVIVSTEKGGRLLEGLRGKFDLLECAADEMRAHNTNLRHPSERPAMRDSIYQGIDSDRLGAYFRKFKHKNRAVFLTRRLLVSLMPGGMKKFLKKMRRLG